MEKDILRKLIIANRNESNFYIACLQKQIDSLEKENSKLKNDHKVLNFIKQNKNLDNDKFNEKLEVFYNKKVNKNLTFRDAIDIVKKDSGKIFINIKNKMVFTEKLIFPHYQDNFDLSENIYNKLIIAYMINFENFFNDILKYFIHVKQSLFFTKGNKDQVITYDEILNNPTKDFKEFIINKQLEKLSYDIIETINSFIKKMKYEEYIQTNFFDLKKDFYELYYRRNIIIHNDGIINEIYVNKTGIDESKYKIGSKIKTTNKYVKKAEHICNNFACLIYAIFGSLIDKDSKDKYYNNLDIYSFALLQHNQWEDALITQKLLLKFATSSPC